jgi:anti-anti-sigma factor
MNDSSEATCLSGGLDLAAVEQTRDLISELIAAHGASNQSAVTLECSAVEFLDGSVLQVLLAANRELESNGSFLQLTDLPEAVERSISLAGAKQLLPRAPNE